MPFTEWGFYIGITDEKKDNIDIISDHWTVKSNLPPYLTLPEKVVVLGSSTITQLKNYIFELSINGNINVEGELSLASKI